MTNLNLSERIKAIAPKNSGIIVNKLGSSGLYEILFPISGPDPQSFIFRNFPNSAPYSGVSSRNINGKEYLRHSFVLYEMPKIHHPTENEIFGAVWLAKVSSRQQTIGANKLNLKTTPFEIVETEVSKLFLSTNSEPEQERRLINLTGKFSFEELSEFFLGEVNKLKLNGWKEIKNYLRELGVEPSEKESEKWF